MTTPLTGVTNEEHENPVDHQYIVSIDDMTGVGDGGVERLTSRTIGRAPVTELVCVRFLLRNAHRLILMSRG